MIDNGALDDKIIAVSHSDPMYNHITSIDQLPPHIFDEIMHFFSVYKQLENKQTAVKELYTAKEAIEIIESCIKAYNEEESGILMTDKDFRTRYCFVPGDVCHLNVEGMKLALPYFEREIAKILSKRK
jgi:hypothetical protein